MPTSEIDLQESIEREAEAPYFRSIKRISVSQYYSALLDSYKKGREDELQSASREQKRVRHESGDGV